eukprot:2895193-Amphidinium_carterae.1
MHLAQVSWRLVLGCAFSNSFSSRTGRDSYILSNHYSRGSNLFFLGFYGAQLLFGISAPVPGPNANVQFQQTCDATVQ